VWDQNEKFQHHNVKNLGSTEREMSCTMMTMEWCNIIPEAKRMTEFRTLSVVMAPSETGQGSIRMCSLWTVCDEAFASLSESGV